MLSLASSDGLAHSRYTVGLTGGSGVQNLPAVQKLQIWSLGWEDPLEKEMATLSSIFLWEFPCTEEPGRLQSIGVAKESDVTR